MRHGFAVWQRRAGFDRHVNFHVLRHSACSAIYRKTKDIRLTQRFARHKSILTTAIYSHPTDEDLVRAVTGLSCWQGPGTSTWPGRVAWRCDLAAGGLSFRRCAP